MLKIKINIILLLTSILCKSQNLDKDFMWLSDNNDGIKQITISKDGKIGIIQNFNQKSQPYFIKNSEFNGDKVFASWYIQWDDQNKLKKLIFAHSNVGFEIEIYSTEKSTRRTYTYLTKDTENFINNFEDTEFNEFSYLEEVKQIQDTIGLLKSKTYIDLTKRKKYLLSEDLLNDKQQKISSKTYNFKKQLLSHSLTKYDTNKVTVDYTNNDFGLTDVIVTEYDKDKNIVSETNGSTLTKYNYQDKKLTEKLVFEEGVPISKTTYVYSNDLLVQETYEDIQNEKKYTDKYEYNEKGKLSLKTISRSDGVSQYKYEYVYW